MNRTKIASIFSVIMMGIILFCSGCGLLTGLFNATNNITTESYITKPVWTPDSKIAYLRLDYIEEYYDFGDYVGHTTWEVTLKKMSIDGTIEAGSDFLIIRQSSDKVFSDPGYYKGFSPPSYSPDGSKWGIIIGNELRVYNIENSLLNTYTLPFIIETSSSFSWYARESYFSWNPNGSQIVYSVGINDGLHTFTLSTEADTVLSADGRFPSWSSDGSSIVYEDGGKVYRLDTATGSKTMLIATMPSIHPDIYGSSKIICRRANSLIKYYLDSGTEESFPIVGVLGNIENPLWSPDGQYITFYSEYAYGRTSLCVIKDDGSELKILKLSTTEVY